MEGRDGGGEVVEGRGGGEGVVGGGGGGVEAATGWSDTS